MSGEARAQGTGYSERAAGGDDAAVLKGLTFGNRARIDAATVYDFRGAGVATQIFDRKGMVIVDKDRGTEEPVPA